MTAPLRANPTTPDWRPTTTTDWMVVAAYRAARKLARQVDKLDAQLTDAWRENAMLVGIGDLERRNTRRADQAAQLAANDLVAANTSRGNAIAQARIAEAERVKLAERVHTLEQLALLRYQQASLLDEVMADEADENLTWAVASAMDKAGLDYPLEAADDIERAHDLPPTEADVITPDEQHQADVVRLDRSRYQEPDEAAQEAARQRLARYAGDR